ncbi:MAG: hypothetical protein ACFFDN_30160 [Candidatus Hodarchaeota archaeon]
MNNYLKFYLKLGGIYFIYFSLAFFIILYINSSLADKVNERFQLDVFVAILTGCVIALGFILLSARSFRIIKKDLNDDKWDFVERDNVQFKLSEDQVYKKCKSCISSFKWNVLEENKITHSVANFVRIIGYTNFGIAIMPDIFIIDISEVEEGNPTAICSLRPFSTTIGVGINRCEKRVKMLTKCLASE